MTDVLTQPSPPKLDDGDHDKFSHIVRKDKVTESYVMGTPVTALCGKTWVPNADPQRFPLCGTCKDIAQRMGINVKGLS